MSSNFQVVGSAIAIAASTAYNIDVLTEDVNNAKFIASVTTFNTGVAPGVTVNLYGGMGPVNAVNVLSGGIPVILGGASSVGGFPIFGGNPSQVSTVGTLSAFTPSSTSTQTKSLYYYLATPAAAWPGIVRHTFYNQDSNPVSLSLYADIS